MRRSSGSRAAPLVSVITATIPGREAFLRENAASVKAQTFKRWEHLVHLDEDREGCSTTYNRLADEAQGEWLFVLADDDLMLPGCLSRHLEHSEADIVYAPPLVWGEDAAQFCMTYPDIPATCLIRRSAWMKAGGYDTSQGEQEDRDLFLRCRDRDMIFARAEGAPTWVYRFHGGNKSRHGGQAT